MNPFRTSESQVRAALAAVDACPRCGTAVPAPGSAWLCSRCHAVLAPSQRQALRVGMMALAGGGTAILLAGLLLLVSSGAIHTSLSLAAAVVLVLVLGALGGTFGAWLVGRVIRDVTVRDTPDARALLQRIDKISLALAGIFCLLAGPLTYWLIATPDLVRPTAEKAFAGKLERFTQLVEDDDADVEDPKAVLKGRVLVLDKGSGVPGTFPNQISDVQFELPRQMRAGRPEEVGTVVWLRWSKEERIPGYRNSKAFKVNCEVLLLDPVQPAILSRKKFPGGPPPQAVPSGKDGYGPKPTQQIIDYLLGLPRQ